MGVLDAHPRRELAGVAAAKADPAGAGEVVALVHGPDEGRRVSQRLLGAKPAEVGRAEVLRRDALPVVAVLHRERQAAVLLRQLASRTAGWAAGSLAAHAQERGRGRAAVPVLVVHPVPHLPALRRQGVEVIQRHGDVRGCGIPRCDRLGRGTRVDDRAEHALVSGLPARAGRAERGQLQAQQQQHPHHHHLRDEKQSDLAVSIHNHYIH